MKKTLTTLSTVLSLSVACGKIQNNVAFTDPSAQKVEDLEGLSDRPECEVRYYDFRLDVDAYALEITGKNGGSFGFNNWGPLSILGLSLNVSKSKLSMNMNVTRVFNDQRVVEGYVEGKQVGFSGNIGFSGLGLGFSHYSATPLSKMTRQGLMNTLGNVTMDWEARLAAGKMEKWSTRVLKSPSQYPSKVVIQAGADSGLRLGDELEILRVTHFWDGTPCESQHLAMEVESTPIAVIRINESIASNPSFAIADITDPHLTNSHIQPGDYVRVRKLVPGPGGAVRANLARSIKLGRVTSPKLMTSEGPVDLASYMKLQLAPVVLDPAFLGRYVISPEN